MQLQVAEIAARNAYPGGCEAMSSWALKSCDIYRDGGSLGAVLTDGSDESVSLFLQIARWDHPKDARHYQSLWVSGGERPGRRGDEIAASSSEERAWLTRLRGTTLADDLDERVRELFGCLVDALAERNA